MKLKSIVLSLICFITATAGAYPGRGYIGRLANDAIYTVNRMQGYTTYNDYGRYLLPIKKEAARSAALSNTGGDASSSARQQYLRFLRTMDIANDFLYCSLEQYYVAPLAEDLLDIREALRRALY